MPGRGDLSRGHHKGVRADRDLSRTPRAAGQPRQGPLPQASGVWRVSIAIPLFFCNELIDSAPVVRVRGDRGWCPQWGQWSWGIEGARASRGSKTTIPTVLTGGWGASKVVLATTRSGLHDRWLGAPHRRRCRRSNRGCSRGRGLAAEGLWEPTTFTAGLHVHPKRGLGAVIVDGYPRSLFGIIFTRRF